MKLERSNIKFPLWRKKVDSSLFNDSQTPIPQWLWPIWKIEKMFNMCNSIKAPQSTVIIKYKNKTFSGNVYKTKRNAKGHYYRLTIDNKLSDILKDVFLMSYLRAIENSLRKKKQKYKNTNIEDEIPFWEFLDIEFDSRNKVFIFTSHYIQKPQYLELFKEIVNSHILKDIEDKLLSKDGLRISKSNWKEKQNLEYEIDTKNVIYNLVDHDNKEIYIGESESLKQRLGHFRPEIKNWQYYRFDSLPNDFSKQQRVAIERLIIRIFASFFDNEKGINSISISDYKLVNKKIDTN